MVRTPPRHIRMLALLGAASLGCAKPATTTVSEPVAEATAPAPTPAPADDPATSEAPVAEAPDLPAGPRGPEQAAVRPLHAGRVLLSLDADPGWAIGRPKVTDRNTYHEKVQVEAPVDIDALPPELAAYVGMTVDLYGPAGRLCTVVLDTPIVEGHLPMAYIAASDSKDDHYENPPADELWQRLTGDRTAKWRSSVTLLVAGFLDDPSCAGALWARDASLPPPTVLRVGDATAHHELLAGERERVLATKRGKKFASEYRAFAAEDEFDAAEPWAEVAKGRGEVWVDDAGVAKVVTQNFGSNMFAPCVWQGPAYGVVRELELPVDDPTAETSHSWPAPAAVFDADLDGRFELLFLEDGGDFVLVHVASQSASLRVDFQLPDNSHVWC